MLNLFDDNLVEEYIVWKNANPYSFSWWNYLNMKADLDLALAFAKFFYPDIIIIDQCFILKDKYSKDIYNAWKADSKNNKMIIEKMMNIYTIRDFFSDNQKSENVDEKIVALANALKLFWSIGFAQRFPDKNIIVDIFKEDDGEMFITVYEAE